VAAGVAGETSERGLRLLLVQTFPFDRAVDAYQVDQYFTSRLLN
jgi:hypothetical protein